MSAEAPGLGRWSRRRMLWAAGLSAAALAAARVSLPWWTRRGPPLGRELWSARLRELVDLRLADLRLERVIDHHVHLVGLGTGGSGAWVSPAMQSHLHPLERVRYEALRAAGGIEDDARADEQYLERLIALQRAANPRGKLLALAFDWHVAPAGNVLPKRSTFHVPDTWAFEAARRAPDVIAACASVHPYREDALERLELAAAAGARAVKWLPNAMGIDPALPRCDAYYAKLAELGLPLISHTGIELAVQAEDQQELGNPLRLRRALDAGVDVIAAHSATLGESLDLDLTAPRPVSSFELFLRLLAESHRGRLFGELSAVTLINRAGTTLAQLLEREDLHARLVYGSDYPLAAVGPLTLPWWLARRGLLDAADVEPLRELHGANSLLFDLVLKRSLRLERGGRRIAFASSAFESPWAA